MTANLTAADENDMPSRILGMLSQPSSSVQAIFPTLSLTVLLPHPHNMPRRNIIGEFNSKPLLSVQSLVVYAAHCCCKCVAAIFAGRVSLVSVAGKSH